jgi:hypothetical protein
LYAFWRSSFKVFRFIGIIFNLFLIVLFFDYKNIDLGFSMLATLFLSIISIFPDSIQDFFINMFGKIKESILGVYNKLKDLLAKLIDYTMEEEPKVKETPKGKATPSVKQASSVDNATTPKVVKDRPKSDWKFPFTNREPIDLTPKDTLRDTYINAKLDDKSEGYGYTYYIIVGVVIIASGFIVYYYWDNITNLFKKGGGDKGKGRETFTFEPQTGDYASVSSGSEPSLPGKYYPEGFLKDFSRKMANMSEQVNNRAKELYNSGTNLFTNPFKRDAGPLIPRREFDESFVPARGNLPAMWKGLPLPRRERTPSGKEFIMFTDNVTPNFVNVLDSRRMNNLVDIVNPITGLSIGQKELSDVEVENWWNNFNLSFFDAPPNSYIWNPQMDPTSAFLEGKPSIYRLDVPESTLPGYEPYRFPGSKPSPLSVSEEVKSLSERASVSWSKDEELAKWAAAAEATPVKPSVFSNLPKIPNWGDVSSLGSQYTTAKKPDIQLPGATPTIPSVQLPSATPKAPNIQLPSSSDSPQIPGGFSPGATPKASNLELPSITTNIPMVSGSTPSPMRSSPGVGLSERVPLVPSGSPYKNISKVDTRSEG